jgi:hypothetical protein
MERKGTIEQGLPETIEDEPTMQQIARLLFSPAA